MKRVTLTTGMVRPIAKSTMPPVNPPPKVPWMHLPWRRLARNSLLLGAVFALGIGLTSMLFWWNSQNDKGAVLPAQTEASHNAVRIVSKAPTQTNIKVNQLFSYQVLLQDPELNAVRYEIHTDRGTVSGLEINDQGYLWWQPSADQSGSYTITITVYAGTSMASQSFTVNVQGENQPQGTTSSQQATVQYVLPNKQKVALQVTFTEGTQAQVEDDGVTVTLGAARLLIAVPTYLYESGSVSSGEPIQGKVESTFLHLSQKSLVRLKQLEDKEVRVYAYSDNKLVTTAVCSQSCYSPFIQQATSGYVVQATISVPTSLSADQQKPLLELADKIVGGIRVSPAP